LQAGINKVAMDLNTTKDIVLSQVGKTEEQLRQEFFAGIGQAQQQLSQQMQQQYDTLSAAQKAEVDARVKQGQDLTGAIQAVGTQTAQQISQSESALRQSIGQLGTSVQGQFDQMSAAQKAEVAARVQQGQDLQSAIQNVGAATAQQIAQSEAGLRQAIGQLGTNVQGQFDAMSAAQKAEVAARVQQGQDLQSAIQGVGTQIQTAMQQAIGQLGSDVRSQFDQMSAAQQAEVAARAQQGQDLQTAIQGVAQQSAQQLSEAQTALRGQITTLGEDLQRQYNQMSDAQRDEVAKRVELGQKVDTAITSVGSLESKLTTNLDELKKQIAAENARKAAADTAAQQKASQEKLLQIGQQATAPAASTETAAPSAISGRTSLSTGEAKEGEFKGPLSEFMKKVEQTSFTAPPGQAMQQQQPTQVAQQQPPQQSNYYSYGTANEIDQILNPLGSVSTMFGKSGGLATPMFAAGGLNVVHHAGKPRMDFRQGSAVSGPGDGQSDDIPAMLADGEFVFPADVVAALGNGSTKAGSDKLYDMMHSIRAHHRSAKPQDLPPPAKKSPLDYLKRR
jgi:hypothetical protein